MGSPKRSQKQNPLFSVRQYATPNEIEQIDLVPQSRSQPTIQTRADEPRLYFRIIVYHSVDMVSNVGLFAVEAAVFQKCAVLCTFRESMLTAIILLVLARYWKKKLSVLVCRVRADTYINDGSGKEILKPRIHFVCS